MGKRKPPKHIQAKTTQSGLREEPSKKEKWWKLPLEILGGISVIVTILGFVLTALPKLSIDLSGSLQPQDPMATLFYLSNDGILPIHDIEASCYIGDVEYGKWKVEGFNIHRPGSLGTHAEILSPGHKMSLPCERIFAMPEGTATKAELSVFVDYRPDWTWWHKQTQFPLVAEKTAEGAWVWKHRAACSSRKSASAFRRNLSASSFSVSSRCLSRSQAACDSGDGALPSRSLSSAHWQSNT
jgi:hypothetical protein